MAINPMLVFGATVTELSQLFGIDRKEVRKRIEGIPPLRDNSSVKSGAGSTWRVRDVAPFLIKLDDSQADLVSTVLSMNHADLPKMLSKEYWYGQNQRLRYLRDTGDLWDTAAVVDLAAEVFKTLRLSLMLSSDAVERETGLTVRQREIIESLMHEALNDAREKLVVRLNDARANTRGKAFAPQEVTSIPGPPGDGDEWSGLPGGGEAEIEL